MPERSNESPRLNVHIRGRGLVVDTTFPNPEPNRALRRALMEKASANNNGQWLIRDVHHSERSNGKKTLAFETKPDQYRSRYEIDYDIGEVSLGGNGVNVGIAYYNTLRAFDTTGTLAPETTFHSRVTNGQIQKLLEGVIPQNQFKVSEHPEKKPRTGYYIPDRGNLLYLAVHTPNLQTENDPLAGDPNQSETHFISSAAEHTPVWSELIARIKRNPESRLAVMPGKNKVPREIENELMRVTDLVTFNKEEAENYLARTNPRLLGGDRTDLLAMAISVMGPKRVLITNGPYAVALYERGMKEAIMVSPPAVNASRDIVRKRVKSIVISEIPIFTGCGDTLVGVFMALEKLTRMGIMDLTTAEQLQLAVNISSFQAWNPASHIGGLQPEDLRELAKTKPAVTRSAV